MDSHPYEALRDFFHYGVVGLREPQFRKLPFRVDYSLLETIPIVREHVFNLLAARVDARAFGAVTSVLDGCKALSAIYADRCGLPFILPVDVVPMNTAPIIFYGDVSKEDCLIMLNAYNLPHAADDIMNHPYVYVLNVLRAKGYRVAKIVSIFDADRQHVLRKYLANLEGSPVVYEVIFEMRDVLQMLKSNPTDFDLSPEAVEAAILHYERKETITPPSTAV